MYKKELLDELETKKYKSIKKEYLSSLINLEITPFSNLKELNSLSLTNFERKILRYNLSVKAGYAINEFLPDKSKVKIYNYDNFEIYISKNLSYQMFFLNETKSRLRVCYYDRTNIEESIEETQEYLSHLEEYYHDNYQVYYGHNDDEEKEKIEKEINRLEFKLDDLTCLERDSEIFLLDSIIKSELLLPSDVKKTSDFDSLYEINNTTNNKNILVYKKTIKKEKNIYE